MDDNPIRVEAWEEIDLVAIVQTGVDLDPQVLTMSPAAALDLAAKLRSSAIDFQHKKPQNGHGETYGRFANRTE